MRSTPRTGPIFSSPQRPGLPPPLQPIVSPAPAAAMAPATAPLHLAEYLCSRLAAPPRSDFAHCEVTEEVELRFGDQSLRGVTTFVGLRKLQIFARASISCDEFVTVRLWRGRHPWSSAVVTRCIETTGGWKIDLVFAPAESLGN